MLIFLAPAALGLATLAWYCNREPLQSLKGFIPVWLVMLMLLCPLSLSARKELMDSSRRNNFLSKGYDQNPYAYIYGSVVERNLIRDNDGRYGTNVTFRPRYTSGLFTESVLFCGNRANMFDGAEGPIVITYQRMAHKMVQEVPCFDLVSIDRVESKGFSSSLGY